MALSLGLCGGCFILAEPWWKRKNSLGRGITFRPEARKSKQLNKNKSGITKKAKKAININNAFVVLKYGVSEADQRDLLWGRTKLETEIH